MTNITLYKAAQELQDLLDQVDPETGELSEGVGAAQELVEKKSEAVAAYILNERCTADMVAERAKELLGKAKTITKRIDKLESYLQAHMRKAGISEIKASDGTFKAKLYIERDSSVEIYDENQLPLEVFKLVPATTTPDKTEIGKRLKAGQDVPGARIIKKDRLTIS